MKSSTKDTPMKKSLGKLLLLTLLLLQHLHAKEPAIYELTTNKNDVYVKEAVEITFKARQNDHSHVMFFFLHPKPSDAYEIKFLTKEIQDHGRHNSSATFKFVLFPLRSAKELLVEFDFIVKTASDEAVAKAYVEDHDDSVGIDLHSTHITIPPLVLHVKPLKHPVDLVGDYTLSSRIDKTEITQYENINAHYLLRGTGYAKIDSLLPDLPGINTFFDQNTIAKKLTPKGYFIEKDFIYALSANNDFTIPEVTLQAFSPARNTYYTLNAPKYTVHVKKIDPKSLLDEKESPNEEPLISYETLHKWFVYLLIFAFGYLSATLANSKIELKKKKSSFVKFEQTKEPKELMLLLIREYGHDPLFADIIERLEKTMRQKGSNKEFEQIKKELLAKLASLKNTTR